MRIFKQQLAAINPSSESRRWLFVPYDQLSDRIGPLAVEPASQLGIVLVESPWKAARRPYHRQKLALVLSSLRHFALEQAHRDIAVRHVVSHKSYRDALRPLAEELGPLRVMDPAERELRQDLEPLVAEGSIEVVPHEGWLTTERHFSALQDPPWRMDAFYRRIRRETGILMDGNGKPEGGKLSLDAENRRPWNGKPPAPDVPRFQPDAITLEVGRLIEERFADHPGALDLESLPASREQVEELWRWARSECLTSFGPYEDAMSSQSSGLFHTRISPLLNLHRLLPRQVIDDVLALDIPLSSKEGFVRQILGWREFVRHVHRATDGFRTLPHGVAVASEPGDGGWSHWRGESWSQRRSVVPESSRRDVETADITGDGGACPSHLAADRDLPPAFWGERSGLACLDHVVDDVWREGWSHHITRLMVLANIATLLDVEPRQLTDWFWVAYSDAFDWVVEPNVLAMGTYGVGELMTTKPYVCGAAYINRMSDYCTSCQFHPKKTCPITSLYWAFLGRHSERLQGNHRIAMPLRSLAKRSEELRARDQRVFQRVGERLAAGETLSERDTA